MERLIVLDTETTGLDPKEGHRIIEIGAIEIINREITGERFHKYINSGKLVGDSKDVHGITDKFLINKPQFSQISDDLLSFIEGSTLIIHNAPFDLAFLNNELKLAGIKNSFESYCNKINPIIDTLKVDKEKNPNQRHSLDALCRRYEIDDSSRTKHGALIDSKILAKVYLAMTGGQSSLFEENQNNEPQITNSSIIKKNIINKEKIKVIFASKEEIKLHKNYFIK